MDGALSMQNFVRIRCCLLELHKCTFYRKVHLCNVIMVMEICCYQYSTTNNIAKKLYFSMKFGDHFSNLLWTKRIKFYLDSLRFDIFIVRCLVVTFFQCRKTAVILTDL